MACGEVGDRLARVRALFEHTIRAALRAMGTYAGTPIEPAPSTRLLDHTLREAGVVCAAVPGAGGNDAIFAVACGADAAARVAQRWAEWTAKYSAIAQAKASAGFKGDDATADITEVRVLPTAAAPNGGGVNVAALSALPALAAAGVSLDSAFIPSALSSL